MRGRTRTRRGMILIAVLFFIALLASGVATFLRRATLDGMIARNRDLTARSEALARGGVQLAIALLLQDRLDEAEGAPLLDARGDLWSRIGELELPVSDGGRLRLRIEDTGARLNLNALFDEEGMADSDAEIFLTAFLEKVIEEMPPRQAERSYDPGELAKNLIDYVDTDDVEPDGEREDDYYQLQQPAYRAANRPLFSLDELGLVEGFDRVLVDSIRPYATVYPYARGAESDPNAEHGIGVNPNTAPAHVLALFFHGMAPDRKLASEQDVRWILKTRSEGRVFCPPESRGFGDLECELLSDETGAALVGIYPPPRYTANVFQVSAEAGYGDVRRTVEAIIDRSEPEAPLILSWRVR